MSLSSTISAPRVSIITAVRNGEKYLAESILSLINQTYIDFELIIIDDYSQDATPHILEEFAQTDPRVRYVKNSGSPGLANALNLGVAHAKGELIARHDADDISLPGRLLQQVAYLDKHLDIDIVGSFIEIMNEAGEALRIHREPVGVAAIKFHSLFGTPFAHPAVMMRAHFLRKNDLRYSEVPAQDYELWVRMLNAGAKGANISEVLVRYRVSQQSDSHIRGYRHALMAKIIASNQLILYTQKTSGSSRYTSERFQQIAHSLVTGNLSEIFYGDKKLANRVLTLSRRVEKCLKCSPIEMAELRKLMDGNYQALFDKNTIFSLRRLSTEIRAAVSKMLGRSAKKMIVLTESERSDFARDVPVFINVRDRLSCLETLIAWLEKAGHRNLILIDNASTYAPLLEFLASCKHRVIRLDENLGHTALWEIPELAGLIASNWYIYTDPDVIPDENCPPNVVGHLYNVLLNYPTYIKAGLGLRIDDLPASYHLKDKVIEWESNFYKHSIGQDLYRADVDTTFALYRPGTPYCYGPAIRTYQARHLPWYINSNELSAEEIYYREHALNAVTTWNVSGEVKVQGRASKYLNIKHVIKKKVLQFHEFFKSY